jgi:hypothetical protein
MRLEKNRKKPQKELQGQVSGVITNMDYLLPKGKVEDIQEKLEEIGELSLIIIKDQEKFTKDELWERAVAINKLGQEIHKDLCHLPKR